jgi:hypothetical protein
MSQQFPPAVELIIAEVASAVRRAYEEGHRRGSIEAVEKMTLAVVSSVSAPQLPEKARPALPPRVAEVVGHARGYGRIINTFRKALLLARDTGVSRSQFIEFCRMDGIDLTVNQYRETIKRLTGGQEAIRRHEVYFPGPHFREDLVVSDDVSAELPNEITRTGNGSE